MHGSLEQKMGWAFSMLVEASNCKENTVLFLEPKFKICYENNKFIKLNYNAFTAIIKCTILILKKYKFVL